MLYHSTRAQKHSATRLCWNRLWYALLFFSPVLLLVVWGIWVEMGHYRQTQASITWSAEDAAYHYADRVALRLDTQISEMREAALALTDMEANSAQFTIEMNKAVSHYVALHPGHNFCDIVSADNGKTVWSTRKQNNQPLAAEQNYLQATSRPDFLLGQDQYSAQEGSRVLTMRYRIRDVTGRTRYFIDSTYRLDALLADSQGHAPWTFAVRDTHDGHLLGTWAGGRVDLTSKPFQAGRGVAVSDYPFDVVAEWPATMVRQKYIQAAPRRWGFELGTFILLLLEMMGLWRLASQRNRSLKRQRQLTSLHVLLAKANQIFVSAGDETHSLQDICDIAVQCAQLRTAFVAKPNSEGWFEILAVAGETSYARGLSLSTNAEIPEGQGAIGCAWREGRAHYRTFSQEAYQSSWRERAEQYGIRSSASLVIQKNAQPWGILSVCHAEENYFLDQELQSIFEELGRNISRGLDRRDIIESEHRAQDLCQMMLDNSAVGIVLLKDLHIRNVNATLAHMAGVDDPLLLVGRLVLEFFADSEAYEQFAAKADQALKKGQEIREQLRLRRADGSVVWCAVTGRSVQSKEFDEIWVVQDITTEHDALEQQSLLASTLAAVQEGVLITDAQHCTTYLNPAFTALTGYSLEDLRGRNPVALQEAEAGMDNITKMRQTLQEGKPFQGEFLNVRKDGSAFWNLLTVSAVRNAQGETSNFVSVHRDMTLRHKAQTAMREMNRQLKQQQSLYQALAAQGEVMVKTQDESEIWRRTCESLFQTGLFYLVGILRLDVQGKFHILASAGEGTSTLKDHPPMAVHAWQEDRMLVENDRQKEDPWVQTSLPAEIRPYWASSLCVPVHRSGHIDAIVELVSQTPNTFDSDVQQLCTRIVHLLEYGLERRDRLIEERRQFALENTLLNNAMVGVAMVKDRHFVKANPRFAEMLGYADPHELIGQSTSITFANQEDYERVGALYDALREHGSAFLPEIQVLCLDGSSIVCDLAGRVVEDADTEDRSVSVWAFLDVTQQHEMQRQLEELATQDHLTGLSNRLALERHILQALPRARRSGNALAVGMLDIDDFKSVNDTWGHEAGDRLLQELAKRLQSRLRGADMLARFGGDEFVLMIEDLESSQLMPQLQVALKRIHKAVETPFEVAPGQMAEVHMSLGLALFPMDAGDKDGLLHQADVALYQVKAHKHDRIHWWRLGAHSSEAPKNAQDQNFDPYGEDAILLLNDMREYFDAVATEFVEQFFDRLAQYPEPQEILIKLSAGEIRLLKTSQARHFRFLLASGTTREQIIERARQLGQIHALVGISAALMVKYFSFYQTLLQERLSTVTLASRKRYQIQQAIERRIQDDVPLEIAAAEALQQRYGAIYSRPLPLAGLLWKDVAASELATLGALPGIQSAMLMRLNSQEKFFAEYAAGPKSAQITAILNGQETGEIADPTSPRGQALVALAWRTLQIQSASSLLQDSRYAFWRASIQTLAVRSNVAIPVFDHNGQVVFCMNLYGVYVNQFESFWMRQFAKGVQWRWQNILQNMRGTDTSTTLTEDLPQKSQE